MQQVLGKPTELAPCAAGLATSTAAAARFSATFGVDTICTSATRNAAPGRHGSDGCNLGAHAAHLPRFSRSTWGFGPGSVTWVVEGQRLAERVVRIFLQDKSPQAHTGLTTGPTTSAVPSRPRLDTCLQVLCLVHESTRPRCLLARKARSMRSLLSSRRRWRMSTPHDSALNAKPRSLSSRKSSVSGVLHDSMSLVRPPVRLQNCPFSGLDVEMPRERRVVDRLRLPARGEIA